MITEALVASKVDLDTVIARIFLYTHIFIFKGAQNVEFLFRTRWKIIIKVSQK